jgi:hypothetical protein
MANKGISLNLLTLRKPTNLTVTDACPTRIRGFSVTTSRAWRLYFPAAVENVENNSIEFLSAVVGVWIELQNNSVPKHGSIMALTDNSSAVCWLKRCSFNSATDPVDSAIACHLATLVVTDNVQLNSQHVKGAQNKLADSLSRDSDMSDTELTDSALSSSPDQVPASLTVCPLPDDVICWIYSTLQLPRQSHSAALNPATKSKTCGGTGGQPSSTPQASQTMTSSAPSRTHKGSRLGLDSCNRSDKTQELDKSVPSSTHVRDRYWVALCATPLHTWRRNSGVIRGQAPFTNLGDKTGLLTEYKHCFRLVRIKTHQQNATVH